MPKSQVGQVSFNNGYLSPKARGRADLDLYFSSVGNTSNWLLSVQGPLVKAPGSIFIQEVPDSTKKHRLIPFRARTDQAYQVELGDNTLRVYRDDGIILDGGVPLEIATPWGEDDLGIIHAFQSADVMWLAHPDYPTQRLVRNADDDWAIDTYSPVWPPFQDLNTTDVVIQSSAETGTITLTASASVEQIGNINVSPTSAGGAADDVTFEAATSKIKSQDSGFSQSAGALAGDNVTVSGTNLNDGTYTFVSYALISGTHEIEVAEALVNETLAVEADSGLINILIQRNAGAANIFAADDVGRAIKLKEIIGEYHDPWERDRTNSIGNIDDYDKGETCYNDGSVYVNISGDSRSGYRKPIHKEGQRSDGKITWEYRHDGEGYAVITGYTSPSQVSAQVVKRLPKSVRTAGTKQWAFGSWSDKSGYPSTGALHEGRIFFAGTKDQPQSVWGSVSDDFESFQSGDEDDKAVTFTLRDADAIRWLASSNDLEIGTLGGEYIADAKDGGVLRPEDIRVRRQSSTGSSPIQPARVGGTTVFVQRRGFSDNGSNVHEFVFDFEFTNRYVTVDLNQLADDVGVSGITSMTYQNEPTRTLWVTTGDGFLWGLTLEKKQGVTGWQKVDLGGIVESVSSIPSDTEAWDELWVIVKRGSKRFVERLEKPFDANAVYLHSALRYTGTPITVVTGLDHLEGELVSVVADGNVLESRTVVSGQVELDYSAAMVDVGLSYAASVSLLPVEGGSSDGSSQGKQRKIAQLNMKLQDAGVGLYYGTNPNRLQRHEIRNFNQNMDSAIPLFSGVTDRMNFEGSHTRDQGLIIEHREPFPCTIVAVYQKVEANG